MPPYESMQAQDVLFMITVGLGLVIAVALARGSRTLFLAIRKRDLEEEARPTEVAEGIREGHGPIPLFIWVLAIGYLAWAVGYIIYSGMYGA